MSAEVHFAQMLPALHQLFISQTTIVAEPVAPAVAAVAAFDFNRRGLKGFSEMGLSNAVK